MNWSFAPEALPTNMRLYEFYLHILTVAERHIFLSRANFIDRDAISPIEWSHFHKMDSFPCTVSGNTAADKPVSLLTLFKLFALSGDECSSG